MSVALLFPGQGAQTVGFLHGLPDVEDVRGVLAEASAWLGGDALALDSEVALKGTVATQLSLLIAGTAFARSLASEGVRVAAVAGMSVGTFGAAVAADALQFTDALALVRLRAELMESAFPDGSHGMAVIEGLRRVQVDAFLAGSGAAIANDNAPTQFVVAGPWIVLDDVCGRAKDEGAFRAERLRVAVPSHGEWLRPAAETLRAALASVPVAAPRVPLFANSTARPVTTADKLRDELAENMARPVRWREVMEGLAAMSVELYLEAPPGHTLAGLARANVPQASVMSASERRWDSMVRAAKKVNSPAT